jgi:DNA-binding response OmpR family regulator
MHTSHARGDGARTGGISRLGGARADFVASLGRKVADLRVSLARVKAMPEEPAARDELRRKLHALGSGAKLMKFDAMDRALSEGLGAIDRTAPGVSLDGAEVASLEQLIEDLPALAWGDGPTRSSLAEEKEREREKARASEPTHTALVVGKTPLADALQEPSTAYAPIFGCESTPDAQAAYDLARSVDPDLLVLDADLPYSGELVEALMDDPATESIPIVVVGSFATQGEAEHFIAMGVARTITKPTSREALRDACEEAVDAKRPQSAVHAILGDPTLEELSEKLAEQIRGALLAGADPKVRARRIALGAGAEVLAPIWGAIARVREVVTARTGGEVRFPADAPEGALAIAPSLANPDLPYDSRTRGRQRGAAADVRLTGRRVVVADDDPAVVWFLADLLKTAGCIVHEAFDGKQALEAAYRGSPDIVLSDILMPELDGFSLCRALRRDVALRDVPVVLLSWKEDLLQRVRELGAGAAGYVRKESDTRAILARMREALRPRAHVETRLRDEQEVRGRLDGVSVRTLLEIVCATRPDARVSFRDASFLYEIEIRSGAPQKAIRTSGDGGLRRGPPVLAALLGISAGRFTVTTSSSPVDADLEGSLASQLAGPICRARAAISLLTGPKMMTIERVELESAAVEDYLRATPAKARELVERLRGGAAPRDLVLDGFVDPSLLEDIAGDLAARGLVRGVLGNGGVDLFERAMRQALRVADARAQLALPTPTPSPISADDVVAPARAACTVIGAEEPVCESPLPGETGSLEDAVLREVSHRSPPVAQVVQAEATMVDQTLYGGADRVGTHETHPYEAAPVVARERESSIRIQMPSSHEEGAVRPAIIDDGEDEGEPADPATRTPFAAVTSTRAAEIDGDATSAPSKLRLWPMLVFVVAAAIVTWAFLHSGGPGGAVSGAARATGAFDVSRATGTTETEELRAGEADPVTYGAAAVGTTLAPGQGVLEITTAPDEVLVVDGTERGRGAQQLPLAAGPHDVRVKPATSAAAARAARDPKKALAAPSGPSSTASRADEERGCAVEVRAGRAARVRF